MTITATDIDSAADLLHEARVARTPIGARRIGNP